MLAANWLSSFLDITFLFDHGFLWQEHDVWTSWKYKAVKLCEIVLFKINWLDSHLVHLLMYGQGDRQCLATLTTISIIFQGCSKGQEYVIKGMQGVSEGKRKSHYKNSDPYTEKKLRFHIAMCELELYCISGVYEVQIVWFEGL